MANTDIEEKAQTAPTSFCYRFPTKNTAELVIVHAGKLMVFPVTLDQLKLAAWQTVKGITDWGG